MIKTCIDDVVGRIRSGNVPHTWHVHMAPLVYSTYAALVIPAPIVVYCPASFLSDLAKGLPNGTRRELTSLKRFKDCYTHTWRAVGCNSNLAKMRPIDGLTAKEWMDELYSDMSLLACVMIPALLFDDTTNPPTDGPAYKLFKLKWARQPEMLSYLVTHHLYNKWAYCWGLLAEPRSTNAHERLNQTMKSEMYFDTLMAMGPMLVRSCVVGYRISRDMTPLALAPEVDRETWKRAQTLVKQGWDKLGYKYGDAIVLPSVALIRDHMPKEVTQIADQRQFIKTWSLEFIALLKNPTGYSKAVNGDWDFAVLMDMVFSFWVLKPIADDHLRKADLEAAGVFYTCTCPQYRHRHYCKHAVALALSFGKTTVPLNASAVVVGPRSAPPGVTLKKRSHCMLIDA